MQHLNQSLQHFSCNISFNLNAAAKMSPGNPNPSSRPAAALRQQNQTREMKRALKRQLAYVQEHAVQQLYQWPC
jgi:hypothetical protein